jgi:hypothetical protein
MIEVVLIHPCSAARAGLRDHDDGAAERDVRRDLDRGVAETRVGHGRSPFLQAVVSESLVRKGAEGPADDAARHVGVRVERNLSRVRADDQRNLNRLAAGVEVERIPAQKSAVRVARR